MLIVSHPPFQFNNCFWLKTVHFYEKQSKGYVSDNGWDLQKIDLGIALCHFARISKECGQDVAMEILDPGLTVPENVQYIVTYERV